MTCATQFLMVGITMANASARPNSVRLGRRGFGMIFSLMNAILVIHQSAAHRPLAAQECANSANPSSSSKPSTTNAENAFAFVSVDNIPYQHIDKSKPDKFPDDWETYSFTRIYYEHLDDCETRSEDPTKPLPSLEAWQFLRKRYVEVVDEKAAATFDDLVPPTLGYTLDRDTGDPIPPPFYAKFSEGKGRGLFASRDIYQGELVHDGTHSDVVFPDAMAFRRYLFSLPRDMACDVGDWHWMQRLEENGKLRLVLALNISSLMNSGDYGGTKNNNVNPKSATSQAFYAIRDIKRGDEILTEYDIYEINWKKVGL